jgi:tRNA (guanine26-N2/guanine27-N2)-dimethyltransferase
MSHCKPGSIKTNASWKDIWHIMLEWVRQRAPLKNEPKKLSAGLAIMAKTHEAGLLVQRAQEPSDAPTSISEEGQNAQPNGSITGAGESAASKPAPFSYLGADFPVNLDEELGKDRDRGKFVRYQLAPRENWGPMSRAK